MPIGNVVQRGEFAYIYDERGHQTACVSCSSNDELRGYTAHQVNIQRGGFIYSYDVKGRSISTVSAPPKPRAPAAPPPSKPISSSQSSGGSSGTGSSSGSGGGALLLLGALAFGAYHYIWPSKKQPISIGNAAVAASNAAQRTASADEGTPSTYDDASPDDGPRPYSHRRDFRADRRDENRPQEGDGYAAPTSQPAALTWADASDGVDLESDRVHKAVAKALTTGTAVMWKSDGHKGYAVPSDLQSGTESQCRNLYERIISKETQISGPSAIYCYDQASDSWSKK